MDEHALLTRLESDQSTMDPRAPSSPSEPSTPPAPSPDAACDGLLNSPDSSNPAPSGSQSSLEPSQDPSALAVDEERHPKGKRKRTAAKDKAVLETAYNANPKPDKAARLDIVKRVSLNEKEVQIWFQNRRQNDRRKSRPLSPQEIAALRYGGMHVVAHVIPSDPLHDSSFSSDNSNLSLGVPDMSRPQFPPPSPPHCDLATSNSSDEAEKAQESPQEARSWEARESVPNGESAAPVSTEREPRQLLSRSFSGSIGYLANRWNTASSFSTPPLSRDDSFRRNDFTSSCPATIPSGSILPPPSSQPSRFRLSMSLEGKAEVVPSIPSPPRRSVAPPTPETLYGLGPTRRPELQRSYSTPTITLPPISMLTNSLPQTNSQPLPPRLTRGRSRDVHAWEFCCDAENREDALTVQAKHESRGSAIAAISLLRSTSATGGSPLQQSSGAKRTATMSKAAPRNEMAKKAKLSRTTSSVARMQTTLGPSDKHNIQRDFNKLSAKPKASPLVSLSGHDSDKENWSPDEDGNPRPSFRHAPRTNGTSWGRRPLPSGPSKIDKKQPRRTPARVLLEGRNPAFLSNRANTAPTGGFRRGKRAQSPLDIYEDAENNNSPASRRPALDDEVERFMRGQVSPSKKGDVDAVAGLLSLSQGNWR